MIRHILSILAFTLCMVAFGLYGVSYGCEYREATIFYAGMGFVCAFSGFVVLVISEVFAANKEHP